MEAFANLIQWIITYSVTGGFWRFLGVWLIVLAITKVFRFVSVSITRKAECDKASKSSER